MLRSLVVIPVLVVGLAIPALAQQKTDLPKSGSFSIHSGWKTIGETTKITDKHSYGAGIYWGVSFNDAGSGPLHIGPVLCTYTDESIDDAFTAQGKCAWSDADGDKIFTDYVGKVAAAGFIGDNTITGGTGKFSGIRGSAPFQCKGLNDKGQLSCTQQFAYRLTPEATGSTTPPATTPSK